MLGGSRLACSDGVAPELLRATTATTAPAMATSTPPPTTRSSAVGVPDFFGGRRRIPSPRSAKSPAGAAAGRVGGTAVGGFVAAGLTSFFHHGSTPGADFSDAT